MVSPLLGRFLVSFNLQSAICGLQSAVCSLQFDNSDYPQDSPYFDKANKKAIGKFKDEVAGIPITEFTGLRFKMYSYTEDNNKNEKTAKGIKKCD